MWRISSWDEESQSGEISGTDVGPLPFEAERRFAVGQHVNAVLEANESGSWDVLAVEALPQRKAEGTRLAVFDRVNERAPWDWCIGRMADGTLSLWGSNDFSYYHTVEVRFHEVSFIQFQADFSHAHFRLASTSETERFLDLPSWGGHLFCIVAEHGSDIDSRCYFVSATQVDCRFGTVFYYRRGGLKPGERIASWVK